MYRTQYINNNYGTQYIYNNYGSSYNYGTQYVNNNYPYNQSINEHIDIFDIVLQENFMNYSNISNPVPLTEKELFELDSFDIFS